MVTKALIYVQMGGVSAHKQTQMCLHYAMARGWSFAIVQAGAWQEAVRLIRENLADVLLLAYRDASTDEIVEAVEDAGGTVEICRKTRATVVQTGHGTEEIVNRMAERGGTTEEIVRLLGVGEGRVRAILRRMRRRK
jgi:hypothetical protein